MATQVVGGQRDWSMTRDAEGYRTYKITFQVKGATTDGPNNVLHTPGLPVYGSTWAFDGDSDPWAFCKGDATVKPRYNIEPGYWWDAEFTFSSKPSTEQEGCQEQEIEDPLLQPAKVSGSFVKYTKEAASALQVTVGSVTKTTVTNSSWEQLKGAGVEFDDARPTVRIEQNVPLLQIGTLAQLMNKVNTSSLWGLPARCVKLSSVSWEKKYYGLCYSYYARTFEFDINYDTFDRQVLDEGDKVLNGRWEVVPESAGWKLVQIGGVDPDPLNKSHFMKAIDRSGNPAHVLLDGAGRPLATTAEPIYITIKYYPEASFLTLGIPLTL